MIHGSKLLVGPKQSVLGFTARNRAGVAGQAGVFLSQEGSMYKKIGYVLRKSIECHLAECGEEVRPNASPTVSGGEFYTRLVQDEVLFPAHKISAHVVRDCVEFLSSPGASTAGLRRDALAAARHAYTAAYVPWSRRRRGEMNAWRLCLTVESVCDIADTLWGRRLGPAPGEAVPVFPAAVICRPIHWATAEWRSSPSQVIYRPGNREAAHRLLRMRRHLYAAA